MIKARIRQLEILCVYVTTCPCGPCAARVATSECVRVRVRVRVCCIVVASEKVQRRIDQHLRTTCPRAPSHSDLTSTHNVLPLFLSFPPPLLTHPPPSLKAPFFSFSPFSFLRSGAFIFLERSTVTRRTRRSFLLNGDDNDPDIDEKREAWVKRENGETRPTLRDSPFR